MTKPTPIQLKAPLTLESGQLLTDVQIAYEAYGQLSDQKDNVILICHPLTLSAQVAGNSDPAGEHIGWWSALIGPGKAIDTNRFYVICTNTLGSCLGSTGPASLCPKTKRPYATDFPVITIADMVNAQRQALSQLGIDQFASIIGPSMGGMLALEWLTRYPEQLQSAVIIAATPRLSLQSLAFGSVGRHAIQMDPQWQQGHYYDQSPPKTGLSVARMIGHITYLSEPALEEKFGRRLQSKDEYGYDFTHDFQIESYLHYQGDKFVDRFDANSYLYLSKAMSYFDLAKTHGSLAKAFQKVSAKSLIISISSDWLYPATPIRHMAKALMKQNKLVTYCNIDSSHGHDSFLIDTDPFANLIQPFLNGAPS